MRSSIIIFFTLLLASCATNGDNSLSKAHIEVLFSYPFAFDGSCYHIIESNSDSGEVICSWIGRDTCSATYSISDKAHLLRSIDESFSNLTLRDYWMESILMDSILDGAFMRIIYFGEQMNDTLIIRNISPEGTELNELDPGIYLLYRELESKNCY